MKSTSGISLCLSPSSEFGGIFLKAEKSVNLTSAISRGRVLLFIYSLIGCQPHLQVGGFCL